MRIIEPDTKDWTWVLRRPCPDCGYDAASPRRAELGDLVRANAATWPPLLASPGAAERPAPSVWSVLEYACHVRDVHDVFAGRLDRMLEEEDPLFANWDQDEAALAGRYDRQHPGTVAGELVAAADAVAARYEAVGAESWARRGRRGDGSAFTVDSLGRYHLHDLVHHAHDVRAAGAARG